MFKKKTEPMPVVLAHFMLGNLYSFSEALWARQFEMASKAGLDGFVLNLGPEDWQWAQAPARLCPANFHLCLSLDMNVLPPEPDLLVARVAEFARTGTGAHQLRKEGKVVLSTFGGGGLELDGAGWSGVKERLKTQDLPVFFAPAFFLPPQTIINDPSIDCTFAWNSAWEQQGPGSGSAEEREFFVSKKKPYMAAVGPCFFTHYGTEPPFAWNKNFIYGTDDAWYSRRWETLLSAKRKPEFVQVLSWNDFGESHYIGPIDGCQPGSETWTDGMDHLPLLRLTSHFIARLKARPPPANEGEVIVWYRTHRAGASCVARERVGKPANATWAKDVISVHSILPSSAPASSRTSAWELRLTYADGSTSTVTLQRGSNAFSLPLGPPGPPRFAVLRGGEVRAELNGRRVLADDEVERWNFNVWSGHLRFAI